MWTGDGSSRSGLVVGYLIGFDAAGVIELVFGIKADGWSLERSLSRSRRWLPLTTEADSGQVLAPMGG